MADSGKRAVDQVKEELFWRIRNLVDGGTRVAAIPTHKRSEREERAEVLIDQDASHTDSEIALTVANQRRLQNCGVQSNSFLASWGDGQMLQVFIHRIEPEAFDFALDYRSYGRVGDFIGSLVIHAGFRPAVDALYYLDPETLQGYGVCVTHDFRAVLALFGFDPDAFRKGIAGAFESQDYLYLFLASSPYFCAEAYRPAPDMASKNRPSSKMIARRDFYRWLKAPAQAGLCRNDEPKQDVFRAEMLARARQRFPDLARVLDGVTAGNRSSVFNCAPDRRSALEQIETVLGDLERLRQDADITSRPAFRVAVRKVRDQSGGRAQFQRWLESVARGDVIARIKEVRQAP